jgi:hypothetical protein
MKVYFKMSDNKGKKFIILYSNHFHSNFMIHYAKKGMSLNDKTIETKGGDK